MSMWRDSARPIIARVIAEVGTADIKALRKALRAAYPFGPYKYHPCKIWRDEINVQLGKKPAYEPKLRPKVQKKPIVGQGVLFGD